MAWKYAAHMYAHFNMQRRVNSRWCIVGNLKLTDARVD
jgi:hypothetical protein